MSLIFFVFVDLMKLQLINFGVDSIRHGPSQPKLTQNNYNSVYFTNTELIIGVVVAENHPNYIL